MPILGKRKSRDSEAPASAAGTSELDAEAIFRRHFEAQFEPLDEEDEAARVQREQDDDDDDDAVDSDLDGDDSDEDEDTWGGCSGEEDAEEEDSDEEEEDQGRAVESSKVIDHTAPPPPPPSSQPTRPVKALPEDAPSLLAQDLELRRLLAESHLLTPSHNNAASASVFSSSVVHRTAATSTLPKTFTSGRTRQKATDLRLQALGSKGSVLAQEKMPMKMRRGIDRAADMREVRRRREAKENGVILERSAPQKKKGGGSGRGRGGGGDVHSPGIGRMRGAELRISESDVRKIEASRDAFGRNGRGRGRGRR